MANAVLQKALLCASVWCAGVPSVRNVMNCMTAAQNWIRKRREHAFEDSAIFINKNINNMETIKQEDLDVINAIQTITKYRSRHNTTPQVGFENITALVDALIKTASEEHTCPSCGKGLKLYVRV